MPTTLILSREDINNPLHPRMWEEICDQLGLCPRFLNETYPDTVEIKVSSARNADIQRD